MRGLTIQALARSIKRPIAGADMPSFRRPVAALIVALVLAKEASP